MGIKSEIQWTDATWNPWQGCTKVSPACAHCYMFSDLKRYGRDGSIVVRSKPPTFRLPLKRRQSGEFAIPPGSKVFTCSWSDWFHVNADPWRAEAWAIVRQRPDVTFQIVTKRTERIADCLPPDWGNGYPNVWLIATAENQEWADIRIPQLLRVPAVVRGLSCEPLLSSLDISRWGGYIDWVIAGGESGNLARPMHPEWVRALRDFCEFNGTAFHFKQWGEHVPFDHASHEQVAAFNDVSEWRGEHSMPVYRVGKKSAGRTLDGRTWDEFPEVQQ